MRQNKQSFFNRVMGRPGVVYVLVNPGLAAGYVKIGATSRTAAQRARELNYGAKTGTPGMYRVVFELRTRDCGVAERLFHLALKNHRPSKWGQEFFTVDLETAKQRIRDACAEVDRNGCPAVVETTSAPDQTTSKSSPDDQPARFTGAIAFEGDDVARDLHRLAVESVHGRRGVPGGAHVGEKSLRARIGVPQAINLEFAHALELIPIRGNESGHLI